jgi:hypothetical protein
MIVKHHAVYLATVASVTMLLWIAALHVRASTPEPTDIWFAPLHPNDRLGGLGAADYFDLFSPSAPWKTVASHVSVFQIYLDLLRRVSDKDLRRVFDELAARNITLAVEMPVLVDTAWCEPGKHQTQWMVPLIAKLKGLGGRLTYVTMVGPLVDGHTYTKEHYCHRSMADVAADAARTIDAVRAIYPDVIVGETEPVGHGPNFPDWSELGSWFEEFKRASGQPIAYLHLDITWGLQWRPDLLVVANQARRLGVKFGVIYNGDGSELSSELAAQNIAKHADNVEHLLGKPPDTAIFQTWFSYPNHVLPEADTTSMTGIVLQYLRPHTKLQLVTNSRAQLLDVRDLPIRNAEIDLEIHKEFGPESLVPQIIEGTVPADARSALFAMRVHTECTCDAHAAALELTEFRYVERDHVPQTMFTWDMKPWTQNQPATAKAGPANAPLAVVAVAAAAGQPLVLNGPRFAANANSHFQAHFLWKVGAGAQNTGYVAIIFVGANGSEVHRVLHNFYETFRTAIQLHTDDRGFVRIPSKLLANGSDAKLAFRGDKTHAASEERVEIKPD